MTEPDSPYARVPATSLEVAPPAPGGFYVVGQRKLAVLMLATCGLYALYWFYRQWSDFKASQPFDSAAGQCWPVMRGLFAVFFVHALLREVKASAPPDTEVKQWDNEGLALKMVLIMIASGIATRLSNRDVGSPYTDLAMLILIVPQTLFLMQAQRMINLACGDPDGASNARLSAANYAWIVVFAVLWLLALAGLMLPAEAAPLTPG